ncbi:integrase domain-containing protein [Gammaproteobacteria bacterium]|nr:integrase domain-containing protein [Gammaproteobacteria bacterium]
MPKTIIPLTKTQIESAKPQANIYELSDGNGLALAITPSNSKIWRHKYTRPFSTKRRTITYGPYPAITLIDARRRRDDDKALLAKGIDPFTNKELLHAEQASARENTFKSVASRWLEVKRSEVVEDTALSIWRSLELYVFPVIGSRPVHELTAPMVIKALEPLEAKGTLETVKRVNQRINEIMVWSVNTGLVAANPLAGIQNAFRKPLKANLPSLPPSELPTLLHHISTAKMKTVTRRLIYWLLHTMVRPSEAAGTAWHEIDFDKRIWTIPGERMKRRKPHSVPLSNQSISILSSMRAISGDKIYVFPSDIHPSKSIHPQTANAALKRLGYGGRLVAHGLRSIASTFLNESGQNRDLVESALAHADQDSVRAAYNRADYLEQRRALMEFWSNHIDKAKAEKEGSLYE